jgi:hypothetical protein
MYKLTGVLAALLFSSWPSIARSNPHALPFSYPYATLPKGLSEIEQYVDLTPVRAIDSGDRTVTTLGSALVTEVEYGLTDRFELGLYMRFFTEPADSGGNPQLRFDGLKQRLRYRFSEPGAWPVDLGLYGEIAEFSDEIELEGKVLLDRRIGRWQFLVNLWAEYALHYSGERAWVANPTAGTSFEIVPALRVGIEYWMHGELGSNRSDTSRDFNALFHHYIGPAVLLQGSRVWWAVAPYIRLDAWGRDGQVGDEFGRLWVRTIIGIEL